VLIVNDLFFSVPASTVHVEAVHKDTSVWIFLDFINRLIGQNLEGKVQFVDLNTVQSGVCL